MAREIKHGVPLQAFEIECILEVFPDADPEMIADKLAVEVWEVEEVLADMNLEMV